MRGSFSEVAAVLTAAENVWNEISGRGDQSDLTSDLEVAKRQLPGLDLAGLGQARSPQAENEPGANCVSS